MTNIPETPNRTSIHASDPSTIAAGYHRGRPTVRASTAPGRPPRWLAPCCSRRRLAASWRSALLMVFTLGNGGCRGDIVSAKGADVLSEQPPAFALEPNDTYGQEPGGEHAMAVSPCRFMNFTADTTIEMKFGECDDLTCRYYEDTTIVVDTFNIDTYIETVYRHPVHVYPDGAQVVDMQPDSSTHRKDLDLVRWSCDEGYDPSLVLRLVPNQDEWIQTLHLRMDPWWYGEWVVALGADLPELVVFPEAVRVGDLALVEVVEDEVVVARGTAGLFIRVRDLPYSMGF